VESARAMAKRKNLASVEFVVDDAQSPQKVSGGFDVISSCLVHFFLPNPLSALKAWRTHLKSNGRIGVTTFGQNDPRWRDIDELFEEFLPPKLLDARSSGTQGPFETNQGMEDLLTSAGYQDVRTITNMLPVKFDSIEKWYEFSWSTGQRAMWLKVPELQRPILRAKAEAKLKTHMDQDGSILFNQEIRHTLATK